MDHLRSGVRDQPDQHGETLSPLKNGVSPYCLGWSSTPELKQFAILALKNIGITGVSHCAQPLMIIFKR